MTPKEKSKEIFDKMYSVNDLMGNYPMCFDTAKKCALIAVDLILEEYGTYYKVLIDDKYVSYWIAVRNEILNL
jgi:hypothetical protein